MAELKIKVIGLPYRSFKQRIRITKHFERDYSIQNLSSNGVQGVIYGKKRRD